MRPSDAIPGAWNVLGRAASIVVAPIAGLHLANGTRFAPAIVSELVADDVGPFGGLGIPPSRAPALSTLRLVTGVAAPLE